jgi:hypothetical protein
MSSCVHKIDNFYFRAHSKSKIFLKTKRKNFIAIIFTEFKPITKNVRAYVCRHTEGAKN